MRKVIMIAIFGLLTSVAMAQTTSGTIALGGGFRFTSNDPGTSSFSLSGSGGYFLKDNLMVGLDLSYSSANDGDNTSLGLGPFIRYYKFIADDKFAFTVDGGFVFSSDKDVDPVTGTEVSSSTFGLGVAPGFAYFFSPKWSLDFTLPGISYISYEGGGSTISIGASTFSPSLGFRYFISK
ncbi:outer membrane beta-barrel protein [Chryseotalea sanaruensis]|nr:outer membrane beta-barrel protein [Chryseotalea sanaruensis]